MLSRQIIAGCARGASTIEIECGFPPRLLPPLKRRRLNADWRPPINRPPPDSGLPCLQVWAAVPRDVSSAVSVSALCTAKAGNVT